jgi:hypothetical protein
MDKLKLREQLQELHIELQNIESLDPSERALLENLAKDVQEVLGADDDVTKPFSTLGEQLKGAVAQVEATHPRVTLLMRQVIDQLSYMGI